MALSLQELYNLRYVNAGDAALLRNRITVAVASAAINVYSEAANTASHAERLVWAQRVIRDGAATQQAADRMLWAVLGREPITTKGNAATDGEIITAVAALVTAVAVVEATE